MADRRQKTLDRARSTTNRRGKRTCLATGIFEDPIGRSIIVSVRGTPHERRYPQGTTIEVLRKARREWKDDLLEQGPAPPPSGTLAAIVEGYLATVPDGNKRANEVRELAHWTAVFGKRAPETLRWQELHQQMTTWANGGAAASTLNKRRQSLKNVFLHVSGKDGANPVNAVPRHREPAPEARGLALDIVERILNALSDHGQHPKGEPAPMSKTKARLCVMATTGLPQAQIARIERRHIDWTHATVYVTPRRKGQGTAGRTLPLTPDALDAFRLMDVAGAWGRFSTRAASRSFAAAVKTAKRTFEKETRQHWPAPANVRAYDLRHSFLTEAYRSSRDLRAVAELALHSDLALTDRYAQAAVSETAAKARDAVAGRAILPKNMATILATTKKANKHRTKLRLVPAS
jgi:integrase